MTAEQASRGEESLRATRAFIGAGVAWKVCVQAYWLLFFVRVAIDLEFSPLELVLLGTAKEVAVLSMEIPTGIMADLYSRKWSVITAFVIAGGAITATGVFDSFGMLIAASAIWGLGLTFRSGAEVAWLTGEVGSTSAAERIVLRRSSIEMVAVVLGVVAATALSALTSNGAALTVFGIALIVAGGALAIAMPETGFARSPGSRRATFVAIINDGARAARRVLPLRTLVIATVFAGFASEAVDRLYVRRFDDIGFGNIGFGNIGLNGLFGDEVVFVAVVVICQSLVALAALRVATRTIAAQRRPEVLAIVLASLLAVTAIGVALLALSGTLAVAAIGLVIAGAMRAASEPVKAAWANEHAPPASRATVQSFVGQAHSLGEIVGGVILGIVATALGVSTALTISAIIYVVSAAIVAQFRRRQAG